MPIGAPRLRFVTKDILSSAGPGISRIGGPEQIRNCDFVMPFSFVDRSGACCAQPVKISKAAAHASLFHTAGLGITLAAFRVVTRQHAGGTIATMTTMLLPCADA